MLERPKDSSGQTNSYADRDPENHIVDGEPRALYWQPYRKTFERVRRTVTPGAPVPSGLRICLIGNNSLQPTSFDLRKKDREPIPGGVDKPGKSAHIAFSDDPDIVCGAIMDRGCRRQDAVYFSTVEKITEAGWKTLYAPLPNQPLHVRLVPNRLIGEPSQAPYSDRVQIADAFLHEKTRK